MRVLRVMPALLVAGCCCAPVRSNCPPAAQARGAASGARSTQAAAPSLEHGELARVTRIRRFCAAINRLPTPNERAKIYAYMRSSGAVRLLADLISPPEAEWVGRVLSAAFRDAPKDLIGMLATRPTANAMGLMAHVLACMIREPGVRVADTDWALAESRAMNDSASRVFWLRMGTGPVSAETRREFDASRHKLQPEVAAAVASSWGDRVAGDRICSMVSEAGPQNAASILQLIWECPRGFTGCGSEVLRMDEISGSMEVPPGTGRQSLPFFVAARVAALRVAGQMQQAGARASPAPLTDLVRKLIVNGKGPETTTAARLRSSHIGLGSDEDTAWIVVEIARVSHEIDATSADAITAAIQIGGEAVRTEMWRAVGGCTGEKWAGVLRRLKVTGTAGPAYRDTLRFLVECCDAAGDEREAAVQEVATALRLPLAQVRAEVSAIQSPVPVL